MRITAAVPRLSADAFNTGTQFPSAFQGDYFFGDMVLGTISSLDRATNTVTQLATGIEAPTGMIFGPDGSLYYLAHGPTPALYKITYTGTSTTVHQTRSLPLMLPAAPLH